MQPEGAPYTTCSVGSPKQTKAWRALSSFEQALQAFTQQLVERFTPEHIILFGSQARGEGLWGSDADISVSVHFSQRKELYQRKKRAARIISIGV